MMSVLVVWAVLYGVWWIGFLATVQHEAQP